MSSPQVIASVDRLIDTSNVLNGELPVNRAVFSVLSGRDMLALADPDSGCGGASTIALAVNLVSEFELISYTVWIRGAMHVSRFGIASVTLNCNGASQSLLLRGSDMQIGPESAIGSREICLEVAGVVSQARSGDEKTPVPYLPLIITVSVLGTRATADELVRVAVDSIDFASFVQAKSKPIDDDSG